MMSPWLAAVTDLGHSFGDGQLWVSVEQILSAILTDPGRRLHEPWRAFWSETVSLSCFLSAHSRLVLRHSRNCFGKNRLLCVIMWIENPLLKTNSLVCMALRLHSNPVLGVITWDGHQCRKLSFLKKLQIPWRWWFCFVVIVCLF